MTVGRSRLVGLVAGVLLLCAGALRFVDGTSDGGSNRPAAAALPEAVVRGIPDLFVPGAARGETAGEVETSYVEGWDRKERRAAGPLSRERAAERDRRGQQYGVLLSVHGRPAGMIHLAWERRFAALQLFDDEGRRTHNIEYRLLEHGRLSLFLLEQWRYRSRDQADSAERAKLRTVQLSHENQAQVSDEHEGRLTARRLELPDEVRWSPRPQFGDWTRFAALLPMAGHHLTAPPTLRDVSDPAGEGLPAAHKPWSPPRPLSPRNVDALFREGTVLKLGKKATIQAPRKIADLPLPTGRVIAGDPGWFSTLPAYTRTVAPGTYPVILSEARIGDETPPHLREAAAKLEITRRPVTSWELALLPGQDPILLGQDEYYGFGVDTGRAAFLDASAEPERVRRIAANLDIPPNFPAIAVFHSGWGDGHYPVWIGRSRDGAIACFVADFLLADP